MEPTHIMGNILDLVITSAGITQYGSTVYIGMAMGGSAL